MKSILVYCQDGNITLEAYPLKIVGERAVILLQDRIHIAELIDGVWTISSTNNRVLDLCDIMWMRITF